MFQHRILGLRGLPALLLVLAIAVAGLGRGLATTAGDAGPHPLVIAGIVAPICHAGSRPSDGVPAGTTHDCCDACALCAPVTLPGAPRLTAAAQVIGVVSHSRALAWAPVLLRHRTPRLAQGPPDAPAHGIRI